ncbi:MAG: efflux RND transporter permease subunit [Saprospiraceae bacterium]
MKIASFSVKNSSFTIIIFMMVLALGLNSLVNMPRGEDPPFNAPIYVITGIYPGTSPADMEELVADPIEEVIYELDDIKKITTQCDDGLMFMQVEFVYEVDPVAKNNDVIREVNKLRPQLPDGLIALDVIRAASSDVVIMQIALHSELADLQTVRDHAEKLEKEIEKLRDIKAVKVQAVPEREIAIQLDLDQLARRRLGVNQVLGAIQANNVNIPGGSLDVGTRRFNIKTNSEFTTLEDIRSTVVMASASGGLTRLEDIAEVRYAEEEESYLARYNGERCLWVNVTMKDKKNIVQVRKQLAPVLESFEAALPPSVHMDLAFDQAESVDRRLSGLGKDFLIAIALVLLTLLPLGMRAASVVMISIPLSLAIGLALLNLMGYTLNQLSIVGMVVALGLLVDDSIVVVENIERFLRMGHSRKEAAVLATKQIGIAVVGCTITLLLAFLPLAFLPEGSGDFIRSLPMAVMLTVIASLFVAITIIPFLASKVLKEHERPEGNRFLQLFMKYLNGPYERILIWAFRHPVMTLSGVALVFVASLFLIPSIGFSLFPKSEKPMFLVDVETPLGSNLGTTDSVVSLLEGRLLDHPQVVSVSSNIGRGNPRVYYNEFQKQVTPNYGQLFVQVEEGLNVPQITAITDSFRDQFRDVAGAEIIVKQFQQGPPVVAPVEIRVFGEHPDTLRSLSMKVEAILSATPGLLDIRNPLRQEKTDLEVVIHREKAAMLGIPTAEIARTVRLAIGGLPIGEFRTEEGEEYSIRAELPATPEEAMATFDRIYVTSLTGSLIPLGQFASLQLQGSPSLIRHFNKNRYASVSAFVATGYNTAALTDQVIEQLENTTFPEGYTFVAAGERETQEESFAGISTIIIIAFFGLLAILVLEFRTFKSTLIVLSVIPLGIIGALVMLYLTGETLSFVATVGMIALVGIEIKNSILLVDFTNQLREQGVPLEQAIMEGAETRFLPILLTAATAIGGLTPLILEQSPLITPLALVIVGGLLSSTMLSRIVTPLLYKLLPPRVEVIQEQDGQ